MQDENTHHPICPKCGYDQSGIVATWETQCPLRGQCTECAYEFEWANVIDPSRVDLLWYVEHASRKRDLLLRTPATLRRLMLPNVFWREVGVHTRIRYRVVLLWVLLALAFFHTLAIVPVGLGNWSDRWRVYPNSFEAFSAFGIKGYLSELHNAIFSPFFRIQYSYSGYEFRLGGQYPGDLKSFLTVASFIGAQSLMWMVLIWVLPVTRARSSIRSAHLVRAFLITWIPVVFVFELVRMVDGLYMWNSASPILNWIPFVFLGALAISIIWIYWFWIAAMKVGWGIRPVWPIAILGSIAAILVGSIIFVSEAM